MFVTVASVGVFYLGYFVDVAEVASLILAISTTLQFLSFTVPVRDKWIFSTFKI
mgnify:CR=1 FL=1